MNSGGSSGGAGSGGSMLGYFASTSPAEKQRSNIAIRECPDGQIIVTGELLGLHEMLTP